MEATTNKIIKMIKKLLIGTLLIFGFVLMLAISGMSVFLAAKVVEAFIAYKNSIPYNGLFLSFGFIWLFFSAIWALFCFVGEGTTRFFLTLMYMSIKVFLFYCAYLLCLRFGIL